MFKVIKKWYFKIYHLFKLLGIFILIFGIKENVYAEEYNECFDKYKIGNVTIDGSDTYFKRIRPSLIVEPNNTYYIRFFSNEKYTCDGNNTCFGTPGLGWDKDNKSVKMGGNKVEINFDIENQILELKIKNIENIYYYGLKIYTYQTNYTVLNNATMIMSKNREDLLTCQTTPEPTPQDNVYSNFLTLYVDRINYLATGFTSNPYLIAMVSIIIAWAVLELTIKIINIRRKK